MSRRNAALGALICLAAIFTLTGCRTVTPETDRRRFEFTQPHMGTLFTVIVYAANDDQARGASAAAFDKIAALERVMSDYDPDSELMRLCAQPPGQPVPVSDELFAVLQKTLHLAELSDGAFDPTLGPLVRLWRRARRTETLPPPEALARARAAVGYQNLKLDPGTKTVTLAVPNMQLDLGGIGKGYAADKALTVLKDMGFSRVLVAASGDIAVGDPPPGKRGWRVSIGAPVSDLARPDEDRPLADAAGKRKLELHRAGSETGVPSAGALLLANAAVSTSGDAEQFVEIGGRRYSHILDPRTGLGLTEPLQVTVVARRATDSDSFATAVSILGIERGLALIESQRGLAAFILRLTPDGRVEVFESRRFKKVPRPGN